MFARSLQASTCVRSAGVPTSWTWPRRWRRWTAATHCGSDVVLWDQPLKFDNEALRDYALQPGPGLWPAPEARPPGAWHPRPP